MMGDNLKWRVFDNHGVRIVKIVGQMNDEYDTQDGAIYSAVRELGYGTCYEKWRELYDQGFRVESFIPRQVKDKAIEGEDLYVNYQGPVKDCGIEIPMTNFKYCRVYMFESGPAIMLSDDPGNWPPLRGIVQLADGYAAFCCECGKLLTRGHKDMRHAFLDGGLEAEYCPGGYFQERTRCYCSATCKQAGEKRRDEMEKGKEFYSNGKEVIVTDAGELCTTWINMAIELRLYDWEYGKSNLEKGDICVVENSKQDGVGDRAREVLGVRNKKTGKKAIIYAKGVEPFTPTPEIDWLKVTDDCANQKRWGHNAECAFCNAVRKENNSIECRICPLNIYAKSNGIGDGDQRCGDLANNQRIRMGLPGNFDPWDRSVFLPVLANLRIWIKDGGMDGPE